MILAKHRALRQRYNKPHPTPADGELACWICGRGCRIAAGGIGYCGLRKAVGHSIMDALGPLVAPGHYYYDPLPTNCVANEVCPGATGAGYPKYALSPRGEIGYYNIAVFYASCNMNCLYCQNWEHHEFLAKGWPTMTVEELASSVNERTTCVCFFGGDPGPNAPHALLAARSMVERARRLGLRAFRVCWETNGLWNPALLKVATELSLETGGIVKIDLKAWTPEVYEALCGVEPRHVELIRRNVELVASYFEKRPEVPLLVVSLLLVPGYVDEVEIEGVARFVAGLNRDIPLVLLGFHPDFQLRDLPRTSWRHVKRALEIARSAGLRRVFVGNVFILGDDY